MSTRTKDLTPEQQAYLEAHLSGTLRPVEPPKDFARRLRNRVRLPERRVIVSRLRDWNRLFLVFGGVMSGVLLAITIARGLFYLFERKNVA
jgi:hypothetical protein